MLFSESVGVELRKERELNKFTLEEVGNKINKTHKMVQLYETGKVKRMNLEVIKDMCRVYGITVGELVKRAENEA